MFAQLSVVLFFVFGHYATGAKLRCSCKSTVGGKTATAAQLQQERYETQRLLETYNMQVRFPLEACGADGYCDAGSINVAHAGNVPSGQFVAYCWNYTGPLSPPNNDTTKTYWRDCAAFKPIEPMLPANKCLDLTSFGINGTRCSCSGDLCNLGAGADRRKMAGSVAFMATMFIVVGLLLRG